MIPKDLYKKVRRIEITTSRLVTDVFAGQYHSVFKGQGIEFEEVREYQMGDDIRTIDWNVSARTCKLHVKKFVEERELTVMVMVDASASGQFASVNILKNQLAAEISALLALSAVRNNDKVGLIIFTDQIEKFIAPRKGLKHVLRVIREVLYFEPRGRGTDIVGALEYLSKVMRRKAIVFMISDFLLKGITHKPSVKDALRKALMIANKRHDVTAITLNDPREREFPSAAGGLAVFEDAETGSMALVDTSNQALRHRYYQNNFKRIKERDVLFRSTGMDCINISTDVPYADAMVKFFLMRRRKKLQRY